MINGLKSYLERTTVWRLGALYPMWTSHARLAPGASALHLESCDIQAGPGAWMVRAPSYVLPGLLAALQE